MSHPHSRRYYQVLGIILKVKSFFFSKKRMCCGNDVTCVGGQANSYNLHYIKLSFYYYF